MRAHVLRIAVAAGSAAGLLMLGGCVVYPADQYYAAPGYGYGTYGAYGAQGPVVVAPTAPPPVVVETYGVAPAPGYLWIGGYWGWSGGRHHWTPGRWEAPRPGYRWAPRRWERSGNGWQQHGGRWERH